MKKKPRGRVTLKVELDVPYGSNKTDVKAYVLDAIQTHRGSLQPPFADLGDGTFAEGDPLFDLDADSVKVTFLRKT